MAELEIRKILVVTEEDHHTHGHRDGGGSLRKVAAAAIVANPFAGRGFVEDLTSIVDASAAIGAELGRRCQEAIADAVDSYGKAGVVGVNGDKEHAHAALTSVFGNEFRKAIGGAEAWIASTKKIGGPGTTIDVPLAYKDEVWVRSHYDTITVTLHDAPLPDEMVIIAAVANRGRLGARVGGRSKEQVLAERAES
ncbi:MAG TPA: amino acid synthesis family protein [Acidimicrobiia bacterium]|nr:amino acid synthesis family protein [Acidimicrobiia bacterium]